MSAWHFTDRIAAILRTTALGAVANCVMCFGAASAQDASHMAIEGYVFDAKTLKPLPNVYTSYLATFVNGTGYGADGFTDANGFYQIEAELPPLSPVAAKVTALCRSPKGDAVSTTSMYPTARTEVYRRDFYVSLPKGSSRCNP